MQRTILEMVNSTSSTDALDIVKVEHAVALDTEDAGAVAGDGLGDEANAASGAAPATVDAYSDAEPAGATTTPTFEYVLSTLAAPVSTRAVSYGHEGPFQQSPCSYE